MAQIDNFFMYENRVEGITDADYQRAQPYVEAAQAFAQTIMPIEVMKKILYALVLLLFFGCKGGTYQKSLEEIDTLQTAIQHRRECWKISINSRKNFCVS